MIVSLEYSNVKISFKIISLTSERFRAEIINIIHMIHTFILTFRMTIIILIVVKFNHSHWLSTLFVLYLVNHFDFSV